MTKETTNDGEVFVSLSRQPHPHGPINMCTCQASSEMSHLKSIYTACPALSVTLSEEDLSVEMLENTVFMIQLGFLTTFTLIFIYIHWYIYQS